MRQFDVFVWNEPQEFGDDDQQPPFTDPALGWFFTNNFNDKLNESDAEWIEDSELIDSVSDADLSRTDNIDTFTLEDFLNESGTRSVDSKSEAS